jgi:hypothetical protein
MHGICHLPIIPLRLNPDDRSEMVSQVLFGEYFDILEKSGNWVHIKLANDSYEGWIDHKLFREVSPENQAQFLVSQKVIATELISKISYSEGSFYVPMGSRLPYYNQGQFKIADERYHIETPVLTNIFDEKQMIIKSKSFLKAPYLWGGKSVFGIDCSGFTQIIMAQYGIQLRRDASQQAMQGKLVNFISEIQTGDLAFFENTEEKITHVGIVLPDFQIIHAHGEVRIDTLDDRGIFNKNTGKHSHRLRFIKRYF